MKFLIEWKESGEQEVHRFETLPIKPEIDEEVFFWLTEEETLWIGEGFDGGDWEVVRCACDECEFYWAENEAYQKTREQDLS